MSRKRIRRRKRVFPTLLCMALFLVLAVLILGKLQSRSPEPLPVLYADVIRQQAAEYSLEPAYIAAVVMAESSFQPDAVSSADARGLMQLLPSTADWIAPKLGMEQPVDLFDPETNLRLGAWYLWFLTDRYGGDLRCATAAYHAGQGTVDAWLQDPRYSSDGAALQSIAYSSTDTYVNRVLKYYEQYVPIYAEM